MPIGSIAVANKYKSPDSHCLFIDSEDLVPSDENKLSQCSRPERIIKDATSPRNLSLKDQLSIQQTQLRLLNH